MYACCLGDDTNILCTYKYASSTNARPNVGILGPWHIVAQRTELNRAQRPPAKATLLGGENKKKDVKTTETKPAQLYSTDRKFATAIAK